MHILARVATVFVKSGQQMTTVDEAIKQLKPWIERNARDAWRPLVREGEAQSTTASRFGGLPWLSQREEWPLCGACHLPMHFLLQLDLQTLPPEVREKHGDGLLQLFYCLRQECASSRGGWEPFDTGHLVRIIVPQPESLREPESSQPTPAVDCELLPAKDIIGWEKTADLPHPEEHEDLGLHYEYDFDREITEAHCSDPSLKIGPMPIHGVNEEGLELAEAIGRCLEGDKLAGWPYWIQGQEYPTCPTCGGRMEIVFQVESEDNLPCMFGDAGCGHIMQCPRDRDVFAFAWACY